MSKELIESLRYLADRPPYSGAADIMLRAADALEARAAPVGEREAFEAWFESINHYKPDVESDHVSWWYSDPRVDAAWDVWQARAAYQRAQQPQSAEAVAWMITYEDDDSLYCITQDKVRADICDGMAYNVLPLYTTPQPSAGVVMPERKQLPDLMFAEFHESRGWNACLDEFARLNGREVGRG